MLYQVLCDMGKILWYYGISIIWDCGIDGVVFDVIEEWYGISGIVFVDGWIGKGVIIGEFVCVLKDCLGYFEQL